MFRALPRLCIRLSLVSIAALAAGGCSSLDTQSMGSWDAFLGKKQAAEKAEDDSMPTPTCTVEFRTQSKLLQQVQFPLKEGMCLQDVVKNSGALRKFGRIQVQLARQLPKGGWHKMDAKFNNSTDRVEPSNDYAVRPGDRVIVTEDTSTSFDRLFGTLSIPTGS